MSTLREAVARRHALLEAAGLDGAEKRDLAARLDVSRSTVDRGVRELEQLGLVERADGVVRRTLVGTLLLVEHERTTERIGAVAAAAEVLSALPNDQSVEIPPLVGSKVVTPTTCSPYRPATYQRGMVERADRVRACATAVVDPQVEIYRRQVVEHGPEVVLVATERVFERPVTDHGDALTETLDTGRVELYRATRPAPFGLAVTESDDGGEVGVTVYDDDGIVETIGNDDPAAVAWGRERFESHLAAAEPVRRFS